MHINEALHITRNPWGRSEGEVREARLAVCDSLEELERYVAEIEKQEVAAIKTLEKLGYTYHGGELWKPPLGKPPKFLLGR